MALTKHLLFLIISLLLFSVCAFSAMPNETSRWQKRAANVTITRDDWGIAHVTGKTDADAVFGMIYAQAEDDFNRVENNYLLSMGRLAEANGESEIYRDLRMKIYVDPDKLKKGYADSPAWLKALMDAWADGLNYYLSKHHETHPRVITHFEPWMALSFTEGSIGADIEEIDLARLKNFYGDTGGNASVRKRALEKDDAEIRRHGDAATDPQSAVRIPQLIDPTGSNGFAIAPSNTKDHHALLLINPHTSFFFRSELQMTSGEGLNAYGAVTWGQFFIYQGWNEHCGWMHTSSAVDQMDEYKETIVKHGEQYFYKYGDKELPVTTATIKIPYKTSNGMAEKTFTVYRTQHGPVVRKTEDGKWVSFRIMDEPVKALTQSYTRTKAKNYAEFRKTFELHTNSSNNTIFADADGNIAYFHANFIPRRDERFDWTKPVDGSDPATDWHELLSVDESPKLLNPASGWLFNSNNWPWSAAGTSSPKQADFPKYVDNGVESPRGLHAIRVLKDKKDFTLDSLIAAAYDPYLTFFDKPLPALIKAWNDTPDADPLKAKTADQIAVLKAWDQKWATDSVATSLAVYWAENLMRRLGPEAGSFGPLAVAEYAGAKATREELIQTLALASDKLTADFSTWKTPWGKINCFQRITDDIVHPFTDAGPCIPVGFTWGNWGSLASFSARSYNGSKRIYGTSGNSFVAVVEFGPRIRARAVTAGGESGDPKSPHFNDQATRYATGNLREVYFYPEQLKGHTEKTYRP